MDTVIVGAGHAGLATSQRLTERGIEHVVLERGRVGQTWRTQRWDSFTLNTPNWMNELPGDHEPDLDEPLDGFATHRDLVQRLERYAWRWELPIREETEVRRVEQVGEQAFRVHLVDDAGPPIECRSVVVASGCQNVPRLPAVAAAMPASVQQLAAIEYRHAGELPPGAVIVVGAGQSGGQIVEDLLAAGREVFWSVSAVTRIPRRYRGRDILEWLGDAGFYEVPPESIEDPAELTATMPIISGVGRYGHTLSLQWLAAKGASLIGRITRVDGTTLSLDDAVAACVRFGDERSAGVRDLIDEGIERAGFPLPPNEPDEADEPFTGYDALDPPTTLDLARKGVSAIIWATGVTGDFGYLPPGVLVEGRPDHQRGATAIEGIDVIGLPWLTKRGSGIINGIVGDAELIGERIEGRVRSGA